MLTTELRRQVDALWDKFWAGGLANPLLAIDQINYLIFLKRLEDIDNLNARRAKIRGDVHTSIFNGPDDIHRWSFFRNLQADDMLRQIQTDIFPWLKTLTPADHPFTAYMRDAAFVIPKASLVVEAVNVIDELAITDRNTDTQGDIYEYMLSRLGVAGQVGQFRTPRHIIRTMVKLIDPKMGEAIMDPACGTAGFLVAAYQHIVEAGTSPEFLHFDEAGAPSGLVGDRLSEKQWAWLRNPPLIGRDFDSTMVRIGAMNMILHGVPTPEIEYMDTLSKRFDHTPRTQVILANPPFAGSIDRSELHEAFPVRTLKTELLFVQLFSQLLVPGGRAAVIVPDGVLFGSTRAHVETRRRLITENGVEAVVSLPAGSFRPYSGSSTAILVFRRGATTKRVWMFDVRADGYTLDDRRLPTAENDLPALLAAWPHRIDTDRSFSVDVSVIAANKYDLSVDRYKATRFSLPNVVEVDGAVGAALGAVSEVLRRLEAIQKGMR